MSSCVVYTSYKSLIQKKRFKKGFILRNLSVLLAKLLSAKCKHLVIYRNLLNDIVFLKIGVSMTALLDQFICIVGFLTSVIIIHSAKYTLIPPQFTGNQVSSSFSFLFSLFII